MAHDMRKDYSVCSKGVERDSPSLTDEVFGDFMIGIFDEDT